MAAYRTFFEHTIPYSVYQTHDADVLLKQLDRAIRDMKPLDEFKSKAPSPKGKPLPLELRALARWEYMKR